ncbi:MAG: CvpA family protein [Planctomycetota bacterium]
MQTYDFVMLFVLAGLTLYGYAKGMAWQVAYLTSFIASYFVAVQFSGQLAPVFGDSAPWNKFMAMAAIYAGFSLATWLVFRAVKGGINKVRLESFDRQMGAIIGAGRGVLWCIGITFFAVTLLPNYFDGMKESIVASQSGRQIAKLLDNADAVMPAEVHQVIGPYLNRLENELNQPTGVAPVAGAPGFGDQAAGGQPWGPGATPAIPASTSTPFSGTTPSGFPPPATPFGRQNPANPPAASGGWPQDLTPRVGFPQQ